MKRLAFAMLLSVSLAGCGQMGPLYFDEDPPADQLPPSRKKPPAPVAPLPAEPVAIPAAPAPEDAAAKTPTP